MSTSGLSSVAAWEVALLRNAVTTLGDVADRLVGWRARMEEVGRGIGTVVWEGPAADAAAASLVHVSTVVTRVSAALAQSLADAERLVAAADGAAELARAALAAASAAPVVLDEQGRLGPLPEVPLDPSLDPAVALSVQYEALVEQARAAGRAAELGAEALQAADRAALAAEDAAAVLATVGVVGGAAPVAFDDLLTIVGLEGTPPLVAPPGGPEPVARWWAALSEEQREAWIDRSPGFVGSTAGVPAWARDRANRLLMHDVLMEPGTPGHEVALATSTELLAREDAGEEVQLYEFDAANGMVALGLGDLDTADDIGVLVPGTATTVTDDLDAVADDAATVAAAALAAAPAATVGGAPPAAPAATVATVAWIGYRTPPSLEQAASPVYGRVGGVALDATLDGLAATRETSGRPAHTVVVAHSYGSQVVAGAADRPGRLAADAVVLAGSPGLEGTADDLEVEDVYAAIGGSDPIWLAPAMPDVPGFPVFATAVWSPGYGATPLPAEEGMGHSEYYDTDRPTVAAIGEVLADVRHP